MKYIESDVLISAMILAMYENGEGSISEDEALKFDMDYLVTIKDKFFPDEPLVSDHISRETLIRFADEYSEFLEFSRIASRLYIKWKPENQELAFRTLLHNIVDCWCKTVGLYKWIEETLSPLFIFKNECGENNNEWVWKNNKWIQIFFIFRLIFSFKMVRYN